MAVGSMRADSPHPRGWTRFGQRIKGRYRGFPAPAGMDRRRGGPAHWNPGIPRTRGDGPGLLVDVADAKRDSPHPRGWTSRASWKARACAGFPAPAGMDPA